MNTTRRNLFALAAGVVSAPAALLEASRDKIAVDLRPRDEYYPSQGHMFDEDYVRRVYGADFTTGPLRVKARMRYDDSMKEWFGTHGR